MFKGLTNTINPSVILSALNDVAKEYSRQKSPMVSSFSIKEQYCHIEITYSDDNGGGLKYQITFKVKTLLQLLFEGIAKHSNPVDYIRFAIHTYFTADLDLSMPVLLARILLNAGLDYNGYVGPSTEQVKKVLQESGYDIKDEYTESTLQYDNVFNILHEDAVIDTIIENNCNGEQLTPELLIDLLQLNTLSVVHDLKNSLYNHYLRMDGTSRHQFYPAYYTAINSEIIFYRSDSSWVARTTSVQFIRDIIAGLGIYNPITEVAWNNDIFKSQGVLNIFIEQLMYLAGVPELD